MKLALSIAALAMAGCAAAPSAPQVVPAEKHRAIVITAGQRDYDDDLFEDADLDEQDVGGIAYEWEQGTFIWEIGLLGTNDDERVSDPTFGSIKAETTIAELYLGARYPFDVGVSPVRPYLGAGVSLVDAELELSASGFGSEDDDDTSLGIYAHAGADWYITDSFFLGLDYRILTGTDLEFEGGVDTDADYGQLALRAGFSF